MARTSVSLWFKELPPALTRVFTCIAILPSGSVVTQSAQPPHAPARPGGCLALASAQYASPVPLVRGTTFLEQHSPRAHTADSGLSDQPRTTSINTALVRSELPGTRGPARLPTCHHHPHHYARALGALERDLIYIVMVLKEPSGFR